jgi:hypothetical protein
MHFTRQNAKLPHGALNAEITPQSQRFQITIVGSTKGPFKVVLFVPLDAGQPAEAEALKIAKAIGLDNCLEVGYTLHTDLDAQTRAFARTLAEMYEGEIGAKLLSKTLVQLLEDEMRQALHPLTEHGREVFRILFEDIEIEGYPTTDVEVIKKAIKSALDRPQTIAVTSSIPFFPWAFIFQDKDYKSFDRSTINPLSFWGFKHELSEKLDCNSLYYKLSATPTVVAAICDEVDDEGWHDEPEHPFARLNGQLVSVRTAPELGTTLKKFDADCLYFYGHAYHEENDQPVACNSWLQLRGVRLTVNMLRHDFSPAPNYSKRPVVAFLNGCRTSPMHQWHENTIAGFLCINGDNRVCCISSVAEIPEHLAAEFARQFWEQFSICYQPIGKALLDARLYILNEYNNPLGLSYSLFGRSDTHIVDPQAPVPAKDMNA